MKKILILIATIIAIFSFSGCSQKKERIPVGYDGKILTSNGYAPEVYQPGAIHVCSLFDFNCYNKLILLETAKKQFVDNVTIRMKDNMNLQVQYVRIVVQPKKDKKSLNQLFNDVKPNKDSIITLNSVYAIYGQSKVSRIIREVLSEYTIDEARLNYTRISGQVFNRIQKEFKNTPLQLVDFSIGKFVYPKIYNDAIENAKKRELEIKKAEADAAIAQTRAAAKIKIAKAEYAVKMAEVQRQHDANLLLSKSITPNLIKWREMEIQEKMMENLKGNSNVVYMPYDMMKNTNFLLNQKK